MSRISLSTQRCSAVFVVSVMREWRRWRWRTPSVSLWILRRLNDRPLHLLWLEKWDSGGVNVAHLIYSCVVSQRPAGRRPPEVVLSVRLAVEAPVFNHVYLRSRWPTRGVGGGQIAPVLIKRRWLLKVVMMILVLCYFPSGGECLRFAVTSSRAYTTAGRGDMVSHKEYIWI